MRTVGRPQIIISPAQRMPPAIKCRRQIVASDWDLAKTFDFCRQKGQLHVFSFWQELLDTEIPKAMDDIFMNFTNNSNYTGRLIFLYLDKNWGNIWVQKSKIPVSPCMHSITVSLWQKVSSSYWATEVAWARKFWQQVMLITEFLPTVGNPPKVSCLLRTLWSTLHPVVQQCAVLIEL